MRRVALWALVLLAVNGAYLAAFAHATIFYEANVLLHLALGLALALLAARYVRQYPIECGIFLAAAALAACIWYSEATRTISARYCGCISDSPKWRWQSSDGASFVRPGIGAIGHCGPRRTRAPPDRGGVLATCQSPDRKSCQRSALDGFGRRRLAFALRAVFGADQHRQDYSVELLHGLRRLRPLPQGHLRTVEKLRAPFRFVQQSVLPEVHRIHAGRGWHAAQQVVRRLP